MNKLKDIIIVVAVAVVSFPILYAVILYMNGMLRIEYGVPKETVEEDKKLQVVKRNEKTDSLMVTHSRTFQALENEKVEIEKERERLRQLQERMDITQKELEEKQKAFADQRTKMEQLVEKSDSLEMKKVKGQAKVYMAMKPLEAAQIIETLPDEQAARILDAMTDDRQKAKIIAALSTEKAARITSKLGGSR